MFIKSCFIHLPSFSQQSTTSRMMIDQQCSCKLQQAYSICRQSAKLTKAEHCVGILDHLLFCYNFVVKLVTQTQRVAVDTQVIRDRQYRPRSHSYLDLFIVRVLLSRYIILQCESKKHQRRVSLITLSNVGRFLKFVEVQHYIQRGIFNKTFVIFATTS